MSEQGRPTFPERILFFGCGNMGGAILRGLIAGGCPPERLFVSDPHAKDLPDGVRRVEGADERFDVAFLGIKPQMLGALAVDAAALLKDGTLLISMLAGIRLASLQAAFPAARIVRLMPNLAAAIGKSPIALCCDANGPDAAGRDALSQWMGVLGPVDWIAEEGDMDLVTALAGSGPAYLYRFVDALARAAADLGLPAEQASRMALATVEGSAMLAASSPDSPGTLADRVASPGGSTREGMNVLDADDALYRLLRATLAAARDRNIELATLA